ncbi:Endonuclease/exonuclease/phosphatase [Ephemerocybe angulata]|uniref:Endonuclease/exonuclease/phosphatase n=1 Tax=Ephemerocybe angulata TaxID=980116 RepID=A0A8H6LVI5_9AGAR|nr:Endonuclease/exonuclease/phosphatase [Tulosesus angulatus]
MRINRIGILALQETHLTNQALAEVNRIYKNQIMVIQSSDPDNVGSKGVAIALNKRLVAWDETKVKILEPGRVLLLTIPWRNNRKSITILTVYTPNVQKENEKFWSDLHEEFLMRETPRPDILLGDFNVVEEPIDRLPPRGDAQASDLLRLNDGWRQENPSKTQYTYVQDSTGSQSRIDRIYATQPFADHRVVEAQFFDPGSPFIGKGRWAMPESTLADPEFIKFAMKKGLAAVESAKTRNVQDAVATYKMELIGEARDISKHNYPKIQQRLDNLQSDLEKVLDDKETPPAERIPKAQMLEEELRHLKLKQQKAIKQNLTTKFVIENETIENLDTRE